MDTKQLICLQTFEYSLIGSYHTSTYCPSCGFILDVKQESLLNRYSSLILLIGASAYIIYKLSHRNKKMKRISNKFWQLLGWNGSKLEPVYFANKQSNPLIEFNEYKFRNRSSGGTLDVDEFPDLDLPLPTTPISSPFMTGSLYDDYYNDKFDISFDNSYNGHNISSKTQNVTIAKIDEVLTQIDDIKKSIVEIDSQLFNFSGTKCANFNHEFHTLTKTDEFDHEDCATDNNVSKFSSRQQQPPEAHFCRQNLDLEWDLTDDEEDSLSFDEEICVNSPLSLPVTDAQKQKLQTMNELLEEAKQMGLLNNILEAISSKVQNRDSAYFED